MKASPTTRLLSHGINSSTPASQETTMAKILITKSSLYKTKYNIPHASYLIFSSLEPFFWSASTSLVSFIFPTMLHDSPPHWLARTCLIAIFWGLNREQTFCLLRGDGWRHGLHWGIWVDIQSSFCHVFLCFKCRSLASVTRGWMCVWMSEFWLVLLSTLCGC